MPTTSCGSLALKSVVNRRIGQTRLTELVQRLKRTPSKRITDVGADPQVAVLVLLDRGQPARERPSFSFQVVTVKSSNPWRTGRRAPE
jgi:hypothetical protein